MKGDYAGVGYCRTCKKPWWFHLRKNEKRARCEFCDEPHDGVLLNVSIKEIE